jgi:hypothetical protein
MTDITTVNTIPVIPSPKGVIFITAGQRPAVKDSHILLLPDKAGRYPFGLKLSGVELMTHNPNVKLTT